MRSGLHPFTGIFQEALESHADAMSTAAQILLHGLPALSEPPPWLRDVERIHQSSVDIYNMVHRQFLGGKAEGKDLQTLRHDLRGLLQNILGRCQLVLVENGEEITAKVREELASITVHARACVEALDRNRDGGDAEEGDGSERETFSSVLSGAGDLELQSEGGRILIADDNANSREVLGRFLEGKGHQVAFATTGREALQRVKESDFDLILLDVVMPEMNGFDVLKVLHQDGTLRHTFVIIISGLDAGIHAIRGIELGAVDFLARPIDLRLLLARVNSCMERQRLRERELSQYFTPELARHLMRRREDMESGRCMEVSVLFCDIVGFSKISERHGPERTIRWLSDVLEKMSACVMEEEGVLVDYTGDQVMALWGAPREQPDHAARACRTALAMQRALPGLNEDWSETIGFPTKVSIGINTGEAYVGNIGTPQKFKYGALGNTVNLGSRVQGACKYVRSRMLVTGETIARLSPPLPSRRLGQVRVSNIDGAVKIYELGPEVPDGRWLRLKHEYETALEYFEARDLRKASSVLGGLLDVYSDDGPALLLMSRVVEELLRGNSGPFDPVWELPGK